MSVLSAPYMHDEAAAFEHVESMLWADGPVCPHCGVIDSAYRLTGVRTKPSKKNPEGKERHGLWKCRECRKQFTVRKGTIFEESHLPLHLWLQAIHLMVSSKKGISSHQLHRVLGITYKSAWFLTHRIRECMRSGDLAPFGSGGGTVEVDETFIGVDRTKKPHGVKKGRGYAHKHKLLTLVDRNTKQAKSIVVDDLKASTLVPILQDQVCGPHVHGWHDNREYIAKSGIWDVPARRPVEEKIDGIDSMFFWFCNHINVRIQPHNRPLILPDAGLWSRTC
jgi:transposase-like protein